MTRAPFKGLALLAALAVLLTACTGNLPRRPDAPAIYLLEGTGSGTPRLVADGPTLAVSAVRAAAGFHGADMIYIEHAHQLQAFARHRWADSPARMVEPLLVAAAENSGLFRSVAEPGSHARSELRLDTELLRLQQQFHADRSEVELALRAILIDNRNGRVLASQVFRVLEPAQEAGPYGGVRAANRAVDLLATELQAFMARSLAHRRSP